MHLTKSRLLLASILFLVIVDVMGQTTNQKPNQKRRIKKKPQPSTKNRGHCMTCLHDLMYEQYDPKTDVCVNPLFNITEAEIRYLNVCPPSARYCAIEVSTVNGVLSKVERRCTSNCAQRCFLEDNGAEVCEYCCEMFMGSEYFTEEAIMQCPNNASEILRIAAQTEFSVDSTPSEFSVDSTPSPLIDQTEFSVDSTSSPLIDQTEFRVDSTPSPLIDQTTANQSELLKND